VEFTIKQISPVAETADCIVLPVLGDTLAPVGHEFDTTCNGLFSRLIAAGDLAAKAGSTLSVPLAIEAGPKKALLVQFGPDAKIKQIREGLRAAAKALVAGNAVSATVFIDLGIKKTETETIAHEAALALVTESYRFDRFKSKPDPAAKLQTVALAVAKKSEVDKAEAGLARGRAIGHGIETTKDLANLPGNVCTPSYLATVASSMAQEFKFKCQIIERAEMEALGMGAFLAVAKGSTEAPKLIVLEYKGAKGKPTVLVGKGITFDTGGLSLKPREGMVTMKTDMSGAAVVLATVLAAARAALPVHLVGVLPLAENAIGAASYRPGDVVRTFDGTTVEVRNTDAEGRMVLADALAWARAEYRPRVLLDVATLTGAATLGLGRGHGALFASDDHLAATLADAGARAGEPLWHMPLVEDYRDSLRSPVADLVHIANDDRVRAGAVVAALFLQHFAGDTPWAHLDIAGPGRSGSATPELGNQAPTGFAVRALVDWLASA